MKKLQGLWVALLLLSAGAGASGAETVPVEGGEKAQGAASTEPVLYFPDYVEGQGWSVQLVLNNIDRARSAPVEVEVYDQQGWPVPGFFDSKDSFEIPAQGSRVLRSAGAGNLRRGWIQVGRQTASVHGLLTYRHAESGIEVGVRPVPLGDHFVLFVEESSDIGTGLAIFKPDAASEIEFQLRDEAGFNPLGGVYVPRGNFRQSARTLPEWLDMDGVEAGFLDDFRGLLLLRSADGSEFAPMGLRGGKRKGSFSAVPVAPILEGWRGDRTQPIPADAAGSRPLYFPDYVDGDGWSVQLALGNVDPARSAPVEVEVYDQQGQPVQGLFESGTYFELPAQGSRVLRSAGAGNLRRGWIKVGTDSASVRGVLTYRHAENGIEVGVAPIELSDHFALFVEESSEIGTGLALFKPEAGAEVEFRIRDEAGNDPLGGVHVPWRNARQSARTLPEWLGVDGVEAGFLEDFRGLLFLRASDGSKFAPLGLRFGKETSALSAVPGIGIVDGVRIEGGAEIDEGFQAPPPTVTVLPSGGSVVVSPAEITVGPGDTLRLAAEAFDENGRRVEGAQFSGSSSDAAVARVDESGMAPGVAEGTAKITATTRDAQGTAWTAVENPDKAALVALYNATDGPNWVNNENWLTDAPLGDWYGVDTDASGRVVRLDLSGRWDDDDRAHVGHGLSGTIPPEIGNLTHLAMLDLGVNGLVGTIPPELGDLANLEELHFSFNSLQGVIPPELGGLANLKRLNLRWNLLGGTIPPELGRLANLVYLNLEENELTGSIPPELRGLANLATLDVGWNNLTGPIPPWLGNLTELRELALRVNDLTGPIPPELGNLTKLWLLLLDVNNLSGTIPPELGNLTEVILLFLYDNGLTGPIPPELGNITHLRHLTVWGNELTGPIPPELGNLANLTGLDLDSNNLTGRVPAELGNLHKLRSLSLSGNLLTGSLPLSFVGLSNLETLGCRRTTGVCVPATDEFREWVTQVEARGNIAVAVDIPFCDEIDASALEALYEATNGSGWTRSDGWLEDENLGRWHGVQTDSVGRISSLDLTGNGLWGYVPEAIGLLVNMTELKIGDNPLDGRLPLSLAGVPLEEFDYSGTSLCLADDEEFREWVNGIPRHSGTAVLCPPLTDRKILEWLYRNTEGSNWNQSAGWLTDAPLTQWHGVETDDAGRVVELRLRSNRLSGLLPAELGELSQLRHLDLGGNKLSGSIPPKLGGLANLTSLDLNRNRFTGAIPGQLGQLSQLRILNLGGNELSGSIPPELGGLVNLTWLDLGWNEINGAIPPELGGLINLNGLELNRNFLSGPVPPELGGLRSLGFLDLTGNQLSGSIPSELGKLGAMGTIRLADNQLTGGIPPQLGALDRISVLDLSGNQLAGPIPSELGGLRHLLELRLSSNAVSGSIPAELGDLANLGMLDLDGNQLSGSIPGGLGRLAKLTTLNLGGNELTGPLPSELGHAAALESLDLRSNALAGPVPPEFGDLTLLKSLILADNPGLTGWLPPEIMALGRLERFMAGGTGLCRPPDSDFSEWFRAIADRRLVRCGGGDAAYLTQTVQSWDDPVPLLVGEPALLRVFVTAAQAGATTMPSVRATFYVDGAERHSVHIPASTQAIPSDIIESNLALSANAEVPDWVIAPGLEMVIEVDPEGRLDSALGVTKRIPDSGRMTVDVRPVPPFRLTLIPFLNATEPDSSTLDDVSAMATDPDSHELLRDVRTLLPVAEIEVVAREPVMVSTPHTHSMLRQVAAMRLMEGGSGYWMGVWDGVLNAGITPAARGVAYLGGLESLSVREASTMAHELGHNLTLQHAPCGSPSDVDPWFPHSGGRTGAWGYDFGQNALVTPRTADVMSYCSHGRYWISDFFFNKALDHRLADTAAQRPFSLSAAQKAAAAGHPARTLLVWGGRDEDGRLYLDPAFVVDAVPSLPPAGGEYTIEGATADGTPVFSFSFDMPVTADAEGEATSFVFTLPVQAGWADNLARITLSGPGGSVSLDESTDRPMAILRDPQTGKVRSFLTDLPAGTSAQTVVSETPAAGPGVEVRFSHGIPEPEAWR